jgi:hypothetical protein
MDDALKHLRMTHFFLLLTAAATLYFNFSQNTEELRLASNLRWMLREGPYEEETFEDFGQHKLSKYPIIYRNYYRLSYRKVSEIPKLISELEDTRTNNSSIMGIQINNSYTPYIGSLAQFFILCYILIIVKDIHACIKKGYRISLPVPWIGAMTSWYAKLMVWTTLMIIPFGSSTFAFLYFPNFLGIGLVSVPIALMGALVSRECNNMVRGNTQICNDV